MSLHFQSIPGNEGKFFWFELQVQNVKAIRVWRVEESIAFHLKDSENGCTCQVPALEHQVVARILFCATLIDVCIQISCKFLIRLSLTWFIRVPLKSDFSSRRRQTQM
jgi:hypothetical protein